MAYASYSTGGGNPFSNYYNREFSTNDDDNDGWNNGNCASDTGGGIAVVIAIMMIIWMANTVILISIGRFSLGAIICNIQRWRFAHFKKEIKKTSKNMHSFNDGINH